MEWVKLGDVASYINGYSFKPSDWHGTGLPIIRIQNLTNPSAEYNYTNLEVDDKYHVNRGDILISWSATLDVFEWEDEPAYLNQHIFKVVFDKIDINKDFFRYAVKYLLVKSSKNAHGSTMKHLTRKNFEKIKFPKYPIEKQEEIANILNHVKSLIQTRQDQIQALDELVESAFYNSFGDYISNKENTVDLKEITSHISSGSTPKGGSKVYLSEGTPLIRSQDVLMNKLDLSNVAYISEETHNSMKRSKLKNKDILLNITGASIGRTAVFNGEDDSANTNQHVASIRLNTKEFLPEFISYYFSTDYFQSVIKNICSGGTREALNYTQIGMFKIPNVDVEKQNQFAAFVEKIEKKKQILNDSLGELSDLFDSLMQDAFDGSMTR